MRAGALARSFPGRPFIFPQLFRPCRPAFTRSPSAETKALVSRLAAARYDTPVSRAAIAALNRPASPEEIENSKPLLESSRGETKAKADARFASLLSMMRSHEPLERVSACLDLGSYPNSRPAVEALQKALHDPHVGVRIAAQRSLDSIEKSWLSRPTTRP
jgi:HEAT repeat protein